MLPRRQTFLYLSLLICVWSVLADHKLYGFHSDELDAGHLVVPRRVDANGEFVSFDLLHRHQQDYQTQRKRSHSETTEGHSRGKRSVPEESGPHELHYQLEVNDELLHLELEPHSYFMTPNLIIERHRRDVRTRSRPLNHTNCHFHGRVRGQSESRVALSTCTGLVGHIKTNQHEYYIEPSKYHEAHATNGHPHVVFHGSAVRDKASRHKAKRKRKQKKKHHQHHQQQQQHTQRHHRQRQRQQMAANSAAAVSNCGTKEPRRRIETRLEWQRQGKVKIQGGRKVRRHFGRQQHEAMTAQEHTKFQYRTTPEEVTNEIVDGGNNQNNQNNNNNTESHANNYDNIGQRTPTTATTPMKPSSSSAAAASDAEASLSLSMASGNGETPLRRRRRRSISSPRHVATLIVADATMVGFHTDQLETYLLTIMNMVSSLYKDPSIGNSIEIVVVKIVLLEEDAAHPDMNLTQNAQRNLDTFCSWQHKLNTGHERDVHHHDVAILITRKNICGNNCMTLGLANVGGMCKPKQSCSVNEDNGIMLSHTIAHELGHNFGMFHDTAKIGCHPRVGSIVHIMTPTFGADTLHVSWSNCSRKYITHFLDQGLGDCLDDAPAPLDVYNYPERPPGVLFNAELQCRLQFNISADTDVGTCSSMHEICSTLWCKVNGECVTNMRPTAPGTSCGKRKWCQNGECVRMAEITPIDGGWGNWSEWSECSRSCGGGVSIQQRECDNPLPSNGGIFCLGQRKRYKICNKKPCPPGEPSFRAQQCSNYDNVPYQGAKYKWLPFFDKKNPCKLFCSDVDDTIIANWGDVVLNGTPCTLGTNNMCIDGICKKVGCDWVVDSDKQEDRCGICGGAGDQCKPVRDTFKEAMNVSEGYVEIVTIPARARNIVIKELDQSTNFLGIAKAGSSKFYLNGDSLISMPGEYIIAGAESLYDRVDDRETITIPQPLEHSIALYVIVRSRDPYKGIYYEFTLPALNVSSSRHYTWKLGDWTECSVTCGGGMQYREPLCYENGKLSSNEVFCYVNASNSRPKRRRRQCNESPCPAHWLVGPWQFCPVTCTPPDGPHPFRRRSVMCLGQNEIVVDDLNCDEATRPSETEPCELNMPVCKAAVAVAKTGSVMRRGRGQW